MTVSTLEDGEGADSLPPEVAAAVAEHPEAVADLLERSGQLSTLLEAVEADGEADAALSEEARTLGRAATGLAGDGTVALGEAVGDNGDDLAAAVEQIAIMQRTGTLRRLVEVADAITLLTDAMDDEMIETLAATGTSLGEVADTASQDDVRRGLVRTLEGVGRASAPDGEAASLGPLGLLGALRDPEVKAGMGHLVAIARGIGAAAPRAPDEGGN